MHVLYDVDPNMLPSLSMLLLNMCIFHVKGGALINHQWYQGMVDVDWVGILISHDFGYSFAIMSCF